VEVATAITLGGPGAVFWMWITAIFGMALAFAESSLTIKHRERDEFGRLNGGPMYSSTNGLGKHWKWLAILFCIGMIFSANATEGMVQANSITQNLVETIGTEIGRQGLSFTSVNDGAIDLVLAKVVIGAVMALCRFIIIVGGIKSIGTVAEKLVPAVALIYLVMSLVVLGLNFQEIPDAFAMIFTSALGLQQAAGGLAAYAVL